MQTLTKAAVETAKKTVLKEAPKRKHCPKCERERDLKFYGLRVHKNANGKAVRVSLQSYCVDCRSGKVVPSQPAKQPSKARVQVSKAVQVLVAKGKASVKKTPAIKATKQPAETEEVVVLHAPSDPATETVCGATDGKIALFGKKATCTKCLEMKAAKRKPKTPKAPKTKPLAPETAVEVVAAPVVEEPTPAEQVEAERVAKQLEREALMASEETAPAAGAEMAF